MKNFNYLLVVVLVSCLNFQSFSQVTSTRRRSSTTTKKEPNHLYKRPTSSNSSGSNSNGNIRGRVGYIKNLPQNKKFIIQSALNYGRNYEGCFDAWGDDRNMSGKNLNLWVFDGRDIGKDRFYTFEKEYYGGYFIHPSYNKYISVDVENGHMNNNQNIRFWTSNGSRAQKFYMYHLGEGRFRIYLSDKRHVITAQNRTSRNGNNVHVWDNQNGVFQEWYLLDPYSKKAYIPK
ncbi:MAG: RICIN domain-containing protein [Marinifilaceae bacterium]|jgi:hypothetical protein|nr:RICIN domain-containing protein [Marinifilaceae bacterium]